MLTVLTRTDHIEEVQAAIDSVERLSELVTVQSELDLLPPADKTLVVRNKEIMVPYEWFEREPPYVLPNLPYSKENLLAIVFYKIGNAQKAFEYLQGGDGLFHHLEIASHLQFSYSIDSDMLAFAKKTSSHNYAIVNHFGALGDQADREKTIDAYAKAIKEAPNEELKVYTAKYYSDLLIDLGRFEEALLLIQNVEGLAISEMALNAMTVQKALAKFAAIELPFATGALDELNILFAASIEFYLRNKLDVNAAILMMKSAEVAGYRNRFAESKDLINKSISIFKREDLTEFLGQAGLQKATLLYNWSKNGQPQYYKAAINAFQDTLKVYKRDSHPEHFADIKHYLGVLYSEIPVTADEKGIWSAFAASSFKEALESFDKNQTPYEYAMVCHNYATALMSFPPAKLHDNLKKAEGLFDEALDVRTASKHPFERALSLMNKLELYWQMNNENKMDEAAQVSKMSAIAKEIKTLTSEKKILDKVDGHLLGIKKLKSLI